MSDAELTHIDGQLVIVEMLENIELLKKLAVSVFTQLGKPGLFPSRDLSVRGAGSGV
jgi:hypothetical protein